MNVIKVLSVLLFFIIIISCNKCSKEVKTNDDTINAGSIRVSVDETLKPLMEAEFNVFEFENRDAHLIVSYKPEKEVLNDFNTDSARAIIITREMTAGEMEYFKSIQFVPRSMPFAKDGISFIVNRNNPRDSFTIDELKQILTGKGDKNTIVVFDNNASSTLRWLKDSLIKEDTLSSKCFALHTNPDVIKYIGEHINAIGIIGTSWISDIDDSTVRNTLKVIKRVRISAKAGTDYLEPYQSEIETGRYPFARMVYCIQRDGKVGLGTGLQRFLYDEKGQLIVLKFGLMPFKQPERSVHFKD